MFNEVKEIIEDWIDYYNNDRCVWKLNKLSPHEFYESIKDCEFHLDGIIKEEQ